MISLLQTKLDSLQKIESPTTSQLKEMVSLNRKIKKKTKYLTILSPRRK